MDSTKTWVDLGFHVFDFIKGYLAAILGGIVAGSFLPQPHKMIGRRKRG